MKKIALYIASIASIAFLAACSGFLEEDNKAGITNEKLYSTAEGYQTLRVNAYSNLRLIYENAPQVLLAGTDLYQMPRGTSTSPLYDYTTLNPTNGDVKTYYQNCYAVLQSVNTAEYYLSIADISADDKNLYQAEYNFLKGFLHFLLIEQFGGIVINDEYTQSPRMNLPRASLQDSYSYAIGKLEAALTGPLPQSAKNGNIDKDIVNHYLAKAYLTRGWDLNSSADFTKARTYADAVIASRGGVLTQTMEQLWSPTNENNNEVILAIQYDANSLSSSTSGNDQESLFGPYLGGPERKHKYMRTVLYPSWSLHSWFAKDDARYDATFMLTTWEFYYDYYNNKANPATNNVAILYPRAWDKAQEMFDEYLSLAGGENNGQFVRPGALGNTDLTLSPEVVNFIQKWCPQFAGVTPLNALSPPPEPPQQTPQTNYLKIYPFIEHSNDPRVNEKYWRSAYELDFCQPVVKKFDMAKLVTWSQRQSYRDVVLATLSETMLLAAEASIGLEEYTPAQSYIQKVLDRPGNSKSGATLTADLPTASKQAALEYYLKESGKELLGQYCGRWPELRRTKMLEYMFKKYNWDAANLPANPVGQKVYRPIPQDAIDLNDGLSNNDQNPGYN